MYKRYINSIMIVIIKDFNWVDKVLIGTVPSGRTGGPNLPPFWIYLLIKPFVWLRNIKYKYAISP